MGLSSVEAFAFSSIPRQSLDSAEDSPFMPCTVRAGSCESELSYDGVEVSEPYNYGLDVGVLDISLNDGSIYASIK